VWGCKSYDVITVEDKGELVSLQPMTVSLVDYLGKGAIRGFQYYLSSRVVLVKENNEFDGRNIEGVLRLDNVYSRETITIEGNTKGVIVDVSSDDEGRLVLAACFGRNPNESLRFIQSGEDRFDLETTDGTTLFGGTRYRVLYAEKLTKLLINLETGGRIRDSRRTEPGRTLDDAIQTPGRPLDKEQILPLPEPVYDDWSVPEPPPDAGRGSTRETETPQKTPTEERPAPTRWTDDWPVPSNPAPLPLAAAPRRTPSEERPAPTRWTDNRPIPSVPAPFPAPPEEPERVMFEFPPAAAPALGAGFSARPGGLRLQVGAFLDGENADRVVERLRTAGFNPSCEQRDYYYRVIINGISEEEMPAVIERLDFAGFSEPWVLKERW
jgi:cell division septation protein DedD